MAQEGRAPMKIDVQTSVNREARGQDGKSKVTGGRDLVGALGFELVFGIGVRGNRSVISIPRIEDENWSGLSRRGTWHCLCVMFYALLQGQTESMNRSPCW